MRSRLALLILATTALLCAQSTSTPTTRLYAVYYEVTPSTAAAILTVQQPASAPRQITFQGAVVYCSVACIPAIEINGAAATTTTGTTATKLDTRAPAASSAVFTASNVGSGTVIGKYPVSAGSQIFITPSGLALGANVAAHQNLTIRTDSITGDVHILLMWSEPQ